MFFPRLLFVFVLTFQVCLLFGGDSSSSGLTAQEYLDRAGKLYQEGKYAEAVALYGKFESDFGLSKEGSELLRSVRFRQAMGLVLSRRLAEAHESIQTALAVLPPLPASEIQELRFWLGVAQIEEKNFPAARDSLGKFLADVPPGSERSSIFAKPNPAAARIPEAHLLIGSAWMLEGKFREAADYFAAIMPGLSPENRGRAIIQLLRSLMEAGDNEAAMRLVAEEFTMLEGNIFVATFQSLVLELGNVWLEKREFRKAIICLQRIWPAERILGSQQTCLDDLEKRLRSAEINRGDDPSAMVFFGQLAEKAKRELEYFKKLPSFDAAVRFRIASAYLGMRRFREAALILEDMLARMPTDPTVEQATVNLVHCWNEIDRSSKTVEAAQAFVKTFPRSASVPLVLTIEGAAEQKVARYDEAISTFDRVFRTFPASEFAPHALFQMGFTSLLAERNGESVATFRQFGQTFPKHELADAAAYWCGSALSLDRQFEAARNAMDEYLKSHKNGQFRASAAYRHAYCSQQLGDFSASIKELSAYLRTYPDDVENSEARILLGDALMNEGRIEDGISSFAAISKSAGRFYEEAVFKMGKAYRLIEEDGKFRDLMTAFATDNPRSPRVAEAIYNLGRIYRQEGHPEKARELYWDAIEKYGNDPDVRSVDDLFPALARLYHGTEESSQFLSRLRVLAAGKGRQTLAMRALWAQSIALKTSDPVRSRELLVEAFAIADVQATNPLLLTDCAEALLAAGRENEGAQLLRDVIKWNPRTSQKDRVLAGLGLLEVKRGNENEALALFERFNNETTGSRIAGRILLAKAGLLDARRQRPEARKALEALLVDQYSSGKEKAEALYRIGESHMADGKPVLAVPYFQRIYVMHGRWRDWVAKAYLRSGEAFEILGDKLSARRTYQELGANDGLAEFPESVRARARLAALGGPILDAEPTKG